MNGCTSSMEDLSDRPLVPWPGPVPGRRLAAAVLLGLSLGCGTTRMTDTQRTATEQLLISNAVDQAVSHLDFRVLAKQTVFLDPQYLDGTVDRGYVVSSLRQHLLACGCLLQEERSKATYVVEARSGGIGTDRHSLLVGIPQTTVPAVVPGQPTTIPEIPFAKKTDQNGVAKVAVFAYNRQTGKPVFQSGVVQALSTAKDVWVLGAGPFQEGTIRQEVTFAGEELPHPFGGHNGGDGKDRPPVVPVTRAAAWSVPPPAPVGGLDKPAGASPPGAVAAQQRALARSAAAPPLADEAGNPGVAKGRPATTPANEERRADGAPGGSKPMVAVPAANVGGKDETQPASVLISGLGGKPE